MLKQLIKRTAYKIAPRLSAEMDDRWWLAKNVRELSRRAAACQTVADYLDALEATHGFGVSQNRSEVLAMMEVVRALRPRRACEIGSAEGGTLFLLTRMCDSAAHVISVDWEYTTARRHCFPRFARPQQVLSLVEGDSHDPATLERVRMLLDGEALDFLFIDGDDSYAGVKQDFELFSPLVRSGGAIAFHDIVPDARRRRGARTLRDSAGVPQFWRELRARYPQWREFIQDPDQDGRGIGMIRWTGEGAYGV